MMEAETSVPIPAKLEGEALEMWRYFAPGFEETGRLTHDTAPAFEEACQTLGRYRDVAARVDALGDGITYECPNKTLASHPLERIRKERFVQLTQVWREWGMTPRSIESLEAVEIQSAESAALDAL